GSADPAFIGLVASRRRGLAVLGYLADRGVDRVRLDQVTVPVGLDLGHTSHREIAVAVLAQLVQLRAEGRLFSRHEARTSKLETSTALTPDVIDPVCGMTVTADRSHRPLEYAGTTYYFCSVGCHDRFGQDPEPYV